MTTARVAPVIITTQPIVIDPFRQFTDDWR
ncbi:unnamed protein product, partial [Rotaria sp. Silwood1]